MRPKSQWYIWSPGSRQVVFVWLDTQFVTDHLKSFGCEEVLRDDYRKLLDDALLAQADFTAFKDDDDPHAVLASAKSGHHDDT